MKKILATTALIVALVTPAVLSADQAKGLNVLVNSGNPQTQAMAMVLSLMSMKKHKKEVRIVLCGEAGDLADKNIKGVPIKRPNGKAPSAKQHLKLLIKKGAKVEVCPLYLPNAGKDKSVLLEGVTIAKPPMVAGSLLNRDFQNITF
ncbi:MAG: DsrE family protein [Campylobacterota bacterium]|nr:DsrE family protein [Campylobacterota bacterium]